MFIKEFFPQFIYLLQRPIYQAFWYSVYLQVCSVPLPFVHKKQQNLGKAQGTFFFGRSKVTKRFYYVPIFYETLVPATAKVFPDVIHFYKKLFCYLDIWPQLN